MGQRFAHEDSRDKDSERLRPPLGLQLSLTSLSDTLMWQFLPDIVGVVVLVIALSDFGTVSCVWLGYIGLTLYLLFIAHDIVASVKRHRVRHMRRVLKKLRVYNFAHLIIQCIYFLIQALWNKACLQEPGSSECVCNATAGACCVQVEGSCMRNQSFVDSVLPLLNGKGASSGQADEFGKLIGLSSTSTDPEHANFSCGAVLLIIFWFASAAMNQPAFDRHKGGATYHQEREWKRARLRKLVSLVRRMQIRSASIHKLWSSTQYVQTLMHKLDSKGDSVSTHLGLSTKDARKEQAAIWGSDGSTVLTKTGSDIKSVQITNVKGVIPGPWIGTYYPTTREGTVYRQAWCPFEIALHPGEDDFTDSHGKRTAGCDPPEKLNQPNLKGQDRWVVRKKGLGGDESIDYFVAPARSVEQRHLEPAAPWESSWQTAKWSPDHPNWDGPNWDNLPDGLQQGIQVEVTHAQNEGWRQKVKRNVDCYLTSQASTAMKAKLGHLTGRWVEPMLDFERLSNGDLCYLMLEHVYMLHVSHFAQLLIVIHTLSQSDVLAMPIFVSLFLHANIHYPKVRSGFWLSAIAWTVVEIVLRFILQLNFDFGNWRAICKAKYAANTYTALSNCALVDDGDYQWYLVPLLIALLHTRESMRRQGEWRETSSGLLFIYSFFFCFVTLLVQNQLEVLVTMIVCVISATILLFKSLTEQETKEEPEFFVRDTLKIKTTAEFKRCKYCEKYHKKLDEDQVQHLQPRLFVDRQRLHDKPCLYRITPQHELKRAVLCAECGSPAIYRVERPGRDPAKEQGRNVDKHSNDADMVIVNTTFCPTMLERLYEGRKAVQGLSEIQGCTKNGQKMVESAFVWASVVEGESVLVMIVQPTVEFYKPGESQQEQEKRMKRYLTEHMEKHKAHLRASFGAKSESARKTGWPVDLKVPTRLHIEPHVPGSVSKFFRVKSQNSVVKKSRMELRHTFDGVLRTLLQSPESRGELSQSSFTPSGAKRWINFAYPGAISKWRITAYVRVYCTESKYTLDAEHRESGQSEWENLAISDLVTACRDKPKRSRFVRLVPRSLVIENETDSLSPKPLVWANGQVVDTAKGYWIPFCEIACEHAAITAVTCERAERTVWHYIKDNRGLPKDSGPNSTLEKYCRKGLHSLHFIVDLRTTSEVESRLTLLHKLESMKAFEQRRMVNNDRNHADRQPLAIAMRSLALAKQEIRHFYEQCWLRDASILKLEEKMSGQNKNAITRICREAQVEMNSGSPLQSAATYAVAVELFVKDRERGDAAELQGEMTRTFLLECLRDAARELHKLSGQKYRNQSYMAALELIEAAIDLYKRLSRCWKTTKTGPPVLSRSGNRYPLRNDARYEDELQDDREEYASKVGNAYHTERSVKVLSSEAVTVLGRQLKQTWGVAKEDISLHIDGVKVNAILKGDILCVDSYVAAQNSTKPGNAQQLSVEYRVQESALGATVQPTRRYARCARRPTYQLDAVQVERIEFLPRPQQMRVIHDFHPDKPRELGWQHRPDNGIPMLSFYSETTTVQDWRSQPRRSLCRDHGAEEPQLISWYGPPGIVPAGSMIIVIDQQQTSPWAVGFMTANPSIFGEIPSSFIVPTPRLPDNTEAASSANELLPSQRALIDIESSQMILVERDFSGQPTLREFEQDYSGFPSLHRDGVDFYTRGTLCEVCCLWLGMFVYASANAIDLNLSIGAAGQADAGNSTLGMVALMVGQFVFIMADRAAYLTQSIRAKIVLLWLSFCVYMTLFFGLFSEYSMPPCRDFEVGTSPSVFCDNGATATTNVSASAVFGIVGLIACAIMRWSFLSSNNSRGLLSQVMWNGILTTNDLTAIIETVESCCYVLLFWTLLSTDRHRTFSEVLFFCLKAYYWYISAKQIRYGYKVEAGKLNAQLLTSNTTMKNHYMYMLWTTAPFLNEIRVAWDWTWSQTTLEYLDAVKLDQMQKFTFLAHCRLQRLSEVGRHLGETQFVFYRVLYGSLFAIVFTGCLWGPMLLFVSSIQFYTYNINDASLTVDLQLNRLNVQLAEFTLHETISLEGASKPFVENAVLFADAVAQGSGDSFDFSEMYNKYQHATAFWSRKDTYVEQVQSIAIGMYPSQSWRATRHTRRQIVADLNDTLAVRAPSERDRVVTSSRECDVPGTACLIFTLTFEKSGVGDDATLGQRTIRLVRHF